MNDNLNNNVNNTNQVNENVNASNNASVNVVNNDKKKNNKLLFIIIGALIVIIGVVLALVLTKKDNSEYVEKEEGEPVVELTPFFTSNEALALGDDIYSKQGETDRIISSALKEGKHSLKSALVIQNPYYTSELTAVIVFNTADKVACSIDVNGYSKTFDAAKEHIIPVYGLHAGKKNSAKVKCGKDEKVFEFDNTKVAYNFKYEVLESKTLDNGIYIVTDFTGMYGIDKAGNIVWSNTEARRGHIELLDNGHFLTFANNINSTSLGYEYIIEFDLLGKVYNRYDIHSSVFGDTHVLENGNILFITSSGPDSSNDVIAELDYKTGKIEKTWNLKEIINKISPNFSGKFNTDHWIEADSLEFDTKEDAIIVSLNKRNSIISLDYKKSNINWIFGDIKNWDNNFKNLILKTNFVPSSSIDIQLNKDGNIVMFDNKFPNELVDDDCYKYVDSYSSGNVVKIDTDNMSASLVSSFDDNKGFFSYAVSNYRQLKNNNYLLLSAWEVNEKNYTNPTCTMNGNADYTTGQLYEIDKDGNVLFKMHVDVPTHLTRKIYFYSEDDNYVLDDFNHYVTSDAKLYESVDHKEILDNLKSAQKTPFTFTISKRIFIPEFMVLNDQEAYLLLVRNDGDAHKYLLKDKEGFLTTSLTLNKHIGKYAVFVIIDGEYYNTESVVDFGK